MTYTDPYGISYTYGDLLGFAARASGNEQRNSDGEIIPPTDPVDRAQAEEVVKRAISEFVGENDWQFRRQTVDLTIGTDTSNESVVVNGEAHRYRMPWYFQGVAVTDSWTYTSDSTFKRKIERVTPETIDRYRQGVSTSGDPTHFAFRKLAPDGKSSTGWEAIFFPTPSSTETVRMEVVASPTAMRRESDTFFGGEEYNEAVVASIEMLATQMYSDDEQLIQKMEQRYARALQRALRFDNQTKTRNRGGLRNTRFFREGGGVVLPDDGSLTVNGTEID